MMKQPASEKALKIVSDSKQDKFLFPEGFETIEGLIEATKEIGVPKFRYYIIKFKGEYFGVSFENFDKQVVFTKNKVIYRSDYGLFQSVDYVKGCIPYELTRRWSYYINDKLAEEVIAQDNDIEIFSYDWRHEERTKEKDFYFFTNYLTILGVVSFRRFFGKQEEERLEEYFSDPRSLVKMFHRNDIDVCGINPYSQEVVLTDGSIRKYSYPGMNII